MPRRRAGACLEGIFGEASQPCNTRIPIGQRARNPASLAGSGRSPLRLRLPLQPCTVEDREQMPLDTKQPLGTEAGQVARNDFADRAEARCQFLVSEGQLELARAGLPGSIEQEAREA